MIFILIAKTSEGNLIYLTPVLSRKEIAVLKGQNQFFCPGCGAAMILKAGNVKIPHFAHRSLLGCDPSGEPETSLHINGKLLLHQFFLEKNHHAQLEQYFPTIKQRADVYVEGRYAIEFQCSALPAADVAKRSEGYKSNLIKVIWIRGIGSQLQEGIGLAKIRPYETAMLERTGGIDYLICFHPSTHRFFYRSNLFYLGGGQWACKTKSLHTEKQSFPFAIPKKLTVHEFREIFAVSMIEREQFLTRQQKAKNRYRNPFWVLCYELGFDRSNLPPYIGVPFKGAEVFQTHAIIWQLYAHAARTGGKTLSNCMQLINRCFWDAAGSSEGSSLLKEYMQFAEIVQKRFHSEKEIIELLYAIYCKSV